MTVRDTLLLSRSEVRRLLSMESSLEMVEAAFLAHGRGETRMPAKIYLELPEFKGDFRAMPAYIPSLGAAGMKWVSSHSGNPVRGLPAVIAVLVLSDPETAEPLAVMDATHLTLMRTGAAGGVAAKHLSRQNSSVLALVGAGVQSHAQLEAIRLVRPIRGVRLHDPSEPAVRSFLSCYGSSGLDIHVCDTPCEAVEGADIIATTTPSRRPILRREWIREGTHINAIGADAPGKQELDAAILRHARIIIDDPEQAIHSGEVNVPIERGEITREAIAGTLGEVVAGSLPGRRDEEEITVFDSTGLAVQDIAVARALFDRATREGAGVTLPLSRG